VTVSGSLSAQATGGASGSGGGDGGFIETSGATLNITDTARITTASAYGTTGTWLIDPTDFTVSATSGNITGAALSADLATTSVTIQTAASPSTLTGTGITTINGGSGTSGNININDAVSWSGTSTLTLNAYKNIAFTAAITAPTGGLTLIAGNGIANTGAITDTAALSIGTFFLFNGNWSQNAATLPSFSATDFQLTPAIASFLRVTGGTGASATPYQITDVYGLQGIASSSLLTKSFVLANNIDATSTSTWNSGAGFIPIGTDGAGNIWNGSAFVAPSGGTLGFTGSLSGHSDTITNLTINRPSANFVGLFGVIGTTGSVSRIGLVGGSVSGNQYVGGLGGDNGGTVTYAYATGAVSNGGYSGGLVGWNTGTINNVYATGAVTGSGIIDGGLVGYNQGSISNSYATGAVSIGTKTYVGGLVGDNQGSISNSYASGAVTGGNYFGGLAGFNGGSVSNSYWDGYSTGKSGGIGGGTNAGATEVSSQPNQTKLPNAYAAASYGSLPTASGIGTTTPSGFVFVPGNSTRPFLAFEVPTAAMNGTNAAGAILINNAHQLQLIGVNGTSLAASYALANTIDLTQTSAATVGSASTYAGLWATTGFVPIGTDGASNVWNGTAFAAAGAGSLGFTGSLNGQNYTITNLTINRPTSGYIGLFGYAGSGSTISTVGVVTGSVIGNNHSGLLVGDSNGALANDYSSGSVSGETGLGGLVGSIEGGTITGSYSSATVTCVGTATCSALGGLVGASSNTPTITTSYATGNVIATAGGSNIDLGGLVGDATAVSITNSYATGNVTVSAGSFYIGGLVGTTGTNVSNSYATGAVSGGGYGVGGLFGKNSGTISNSYATGPVSGGGYVGGLGGYSNNNITNVYATGTVTGSASYIGGLIGANGGKLTNAYATGAVSGGGYVGGLVGYNSSTITNAYASGAVSGSGSYFGGLVGYENGSIVGSYWDGYSTGKGSTALGHLASGSATGFTEVSSQPGQTALPNAFSASSYGSLTAPSWIFLPGARPVLSFQGDAALTPVSGVVTITTPLQLAYINSDATTLSQNYVLGGNINLAQSLAATAVTGTPGSYAGVFANGVSFTTLAPIGSDGAGKVWNGSAFVALSSIAANGTFGFSGSFNGNGYTISGLSFNLPTINDVGLFGVSQGAISNLTVSGTVKGKNSTGGVVGLLINGGSLTNVTSSVNVTGNNITGSLVGNQEDGTSIMRSSASGTVGGVSDVGGLVGYSQNATIARSAATGTVTGTNYTGGLIGYSYNSTISNTDAQSSVSGSYIAGGLVGNLNGGSLTNSFAAGTVSAPTRAGGLLGNIANSASVTSSYWNNTIGPLLSAGGVGYSTTALQSASGYATLFSGWDFTTVWTAPTGSAYPTLK